MTIYARIQLRDLTTFQRLPSHRAFKEAEVVGQNPSECYFIEDDGTDHVKISQGETAIRVPWSNILAATPLVVAPTPVALPEPGPLLQSLIDEKRLAGVPVTTQSAFTHEAAVVAVQEAKAEYDKGFPVLPRATKGPRKGGILR